MNQLLKSQRRLTAAFRLNPVIVSLLLGAALILGPAWPGQGNAVAGSSQIYPPYGPIECFEVCERECQAVHQSCIDVHERRGAGPVRVFVSCTIPYNRCKNGCEERCNQLPWPVYPGY